MNPSPDARQPADRLRRDFLGAALCTPVAAAAALAGMDALAPVPLLPAALPQVLPAAPRGYHLSEHIRACYATSRY